MILIHRFQLSQLLRMARSNIKKKTFGLWAIKIHPEELEVSPSLQCKSQDNQIYNRIQIVEEIEKNYLGLERHRI